MRKIPFAESNSRPNVSEGYEVTSELPGRPVYITNAQTVALEMKVNVGANTV